MYQSKQITEQRTVDSSAWALGKHSACETTQVIERSAAVTYLGLSDFLGLSRSLELSMAAAIVAGSASCLLHGSLLGLKVT